MDNTNGNVRIVGPGQACRQTESPLAWSQAGGGGSGAVGQVQLKGWTNGTEDSYLCASPTGLQVWGCGAANQTPVTTALTFTAIAVKPYDNYNGGTVTLWVNGQPTALSVSFPAGSEDVVIARADVPVPAGAVYTARGDCPTCLPNQGGYFFNVTLEYR